MNIFQKQLSRKGVRQLIKFVIVGFFHTLLDWALFYLFKAPLKGQTGKQIAKGLSFVFSSSSSYFFNRLWTFRSRDSQVAKQMAQFFTVSLVGLAVNNLIFYLITSPEMFAKSDIIGLALASVFSGFWNFFVNKYWTFK